MPRKEEWEKEAEDAKRVEAWSLEGPTRLVKAVTLDREWATKLKGFVTVEKSILGMSPHEIETGLGLPSGVFDGGCRIYSFKQLPGPSQVDYELTADHPDGQAFDEWGALEEIIQRRGNPARESKPIYPPGSRAIHQWCVKAELPVTHVIDLLPTVSYPYFHNSFESKNRKP